MMDPHYAGVNTEFPDTNKYHPPQDYDLIARTLKDERPLEFRVINGSVDSVDSSAAATLKGAEDRGMITMGYTFGPWNIDHFLQLYPPKAGRIPEIDFESNGPPLSAKAAEDAAIKLHSAWGVWPVFYCGYYPWLSVGQPAGTAMENCLWLPARYSSTPPLRPRGLGPAFGWQYSNGTNQWPRPPGSHITFPGIGSVDMNSMNITADQLKELAQLTVPPPQQGDDDLTNDQASQLTKVAGFVEGMRLAGEEKPRPAGPYAAAGWDAAKADAKVLAQP